MYKHILVPTDGSTLSMKAAKAASRLARTLGAKITALYVIEPYSPPMGGDGMIFYAGGFSPDDYQQAAEKTARKALDKVKTVAQGEDVRCTTTFITEAQPWEAIVKAARSKKCDLIVMASHGRKGLTGLLLGSETTKVLTHSRTPVLVCR